MIGPRQSSPTAHVQPIALNLAPLGFLEVAPPALVAIAAEAGFGSVSLRMRPAVAGGSHYPLAVGSPLARETLARLRQTGIGVLQAELVPLEKTTDVGACRPLLEAATALGATRLVVTGDDPDPAVVAGKLAEIADLAREYGMTVDVEFMRFRCLATLGQALAAVAAAGRDNVAVMVDALHLVRSGGGAADVAAADPRRLGVLQLCDAPLAAPAPERLAAEARESRLLPGRGELPLGALLDAMPAHTILAAEVPLAARVPAVPPHERARAIYEATVELLTAHRPVPDVDPPGG